MSRYVIATALFLLLAAAPAALAQQFGVGANPHAEMLAIAPADLEWSDLTPPGFDPGMKVAVISGDPAAEGPYTLRLSFPDGYRFPPHWHGMDENLTVVSGTFLLAMGARADESRLRRYQPGSFLYMPATQPHYGGAEGKTIIQLHGMGPFTIELADPDAAEDGA